MCRCAPCPTPPLKLCPDSFSCSTCPPQARYCQRLHSSQSFTHHPPGHKFVRVAPKRLPAKWPVLARAARRAACEEGRARGAEEGRVYCADEARRVWVQQDYAQRAPGPQGRGGDSAGPDVPLHGGVYLRWTPCRAQGMQMRMQVCMTAQAFTTACKRACIRMGKTATFATGRHLV